MGSQDPTSYTGSSDTDPWDPGIPVCDSQSPGGSVFLGISECTDTGTRLRIGMEFFTGIHLEFGVLGSTGSLPILTDCTDTAGIPYGLYWDPMHGISGAFAKECGRTVSDE